MDVSKTFLYLLAIRLATSTDVNLDCQIDTCTEVAVFTCITNSAVATGARWFIDGREDFDTAVFKPEFIPAHGTALLSASVDAVDSVSTIQCSLTFPSGEVLSSDEIPIGCQPPTESPTCVTTTSDVTSTSSPDSSTSAPTTAVPTTNSNGGSTDPTTTDPDQKPESHGVTAAVVVIAVLAVLVIIVVVVTIMCCKRRCRLAKERRLASSMVDFRPPRLLPVIRRSEAQGIPRHDSRRGHGYRALTAGPDGYYEAPRKTPFSFSGNPSDHDILDKELEHLYPTPIRIGFKLACRGLYMFHYLYHDL